MRTLFVETGFPVPTAIFFVSYMVIYIYIYIYQKDLYVYQRNGKKQGGIVRKETEELLYRNKASLCANKM